MVPDLTAVLLSKVLFMSVVAISSEELAVRIPSTM